VDPLVVPIDAEDDADRASKGESDDTLQLSRDSEDKVVLLRVDRRAGILLV
jgi:hypothetical protein